MPSNNDNSAHTHSQVDLCDTGKKIYADALRSGRISRSAAEAAPCLIDLALLHPDTDDPKWLRPVPPSAALAQLLLPLEREIQERRHLATDLTGAFEPFMAISAQNSPSHAVTVLEGMSRINASLDRVVAECTEELLTVQPGSQRPDHAFRDAVRRMQPLIERGVPVRTLYHHTARHTQNTLAYLAEVKLANLEVRTLEETIERLIIIDRKVAFIPARADRTVALELHHPGLIWYLVGVFDQFWQRATPFEQELPYPDRPEGITGVQRSIAKLLVEGHLDEAIARRLGMNVRTCRAHVAKLSAALGSGSRTQLGYLIARSGIVDDD